MRTLLIIVGFLAAVLGLIMTILPFGALGFIPVALALIIGILSLRMSRTEGASTTPSKLIIILGGLGLILGIYRTVFDKNVVTEDEEIIRQDEESLEDAKKELEDIEIDE